jgi:hypothetical protein
MSSTPDVCTVAGSVVTLVSTGRCILAAKSVGTLSIAPAREVKLELSVSGPRRSAAIDQRLKVLPLRDEALLIATLFSLDPDTQWIVESRTSDTCVIQSSQFRTLSRGTCYLSVRSEGSSSVREFPGTPLFALVVTGDVQEIVAKPSMPRFVAKRQYALPFYASSGASIQGESLAPKVCVVSNQLIKTIKAGRCVLLLTQSGTPRFEPIQRKVVLVVK